MATKRFETSARIENTPQAVMDYVADPRNRPLFFPSLKSISDLQGAPCAVGTTWKWTFATLGMEFQGTGRCVAHEMGKLYSFTTEGGIDSTFTYTADPEGTGTLLKIRLEYSVPEAVRPRLPSESIGESMMKSEAELVIQNLKNILDR